LTPESLKEYRQLCRQTLQARAVNKIDSILITGATGSFGTAFIRFLLDSTQIQRICLYSRGEHAQASARAAFGDDSRLRWMVGDVRDLARLTRACRGCDAIVHAAALKRIETGAYNPDEMVKTNVLGTMNVIEAAIVAGVKNVVGLSSDKAYQPISPYGQSKALAESLMLAANFLSGTKGPRFSCTRYGNIWNAQGSVVPKWRALAAQGKPLPITHPDCTRFYMTIDEAVKMVWDLLCTMHGGELVIPDWLPAYRLGDLLQAFVEAYGVNHIYGSGLPKFEKLHESMNAELCSENARRMTVEELMELLP
jgi:UDP-N-acetylglucosamine 4,6-dehydratase